MTTTETPRTDFYTSISDLEAACIKHMLSNGFPLDKPLILNGKHQRFSKDKNKRKKDEWYIAKEWEFRGKTYLYCSYGSWSRQEEKFHYKSWEHREEERLSPKERQDLQTYLKKIEKNLEAERKNRHEEAAQEADQIWKNASKEPTNPAHKDYLTLKGVQAHNIRFGENLSGYDALIIPMWNIKKELRSLQFISVSKEGTVYKSFLTGAEKRGCFSVLGSINETTGFYVAEGYSTAATIHEATGEAVVIAFDCGNLEPVICELRKKFPKHKITICADDDQKTALQGKGNPGKDNALAAAKKYSCYIKLPQFEASFRLPSGDLPSDFNDLHQHFGIDEVKRQLDVEGQPEYPFSDIVEKYNQTFAIVEAPGFFIIENSGKEGYLPYKRHDFIHRFENRIVEAGYDESKNKPIYKSEAEIWLKSLHRTTYHRIELNPEVIGHYEENGKWIFNLWQGLSVTPKEGSWDLIKEHLFHIICQKEKTLFDYLIKVFAHWVQKPWKRTVALIMRGDQGAGKGAVAQLIGRYFGDAFGHYNSSGQVFGKFNAAIQNKVVLFLDEAACGDKSLSGQIKTLITEELIYIERKGFDPVALKNPRKLIVSSNEDFAIPTDADDRRFLFLDVSSERCEDEDYFLKLYDQINNGGAEAFLHYLLNVDLSEFNANFLPQKQTHGFDQKLATSNSFIQYLHSCLEAGKLEIQGSGKYQEGSSPWLEEITKIRVERVNIYYNEYCHARSLPIIPDVYIGRTLTKFFRNIRQRVRGDDQIRYYQYCFPPLSESKERFASFFKVEVGVAFED